MLPHYLGLTARGCNWIAAISSNFVLYLASLSIVMTLPSLLRMYVPRACRSCLNYSNSFESYQGVTGLLARLTELRA